MKKGIIQCVCQSMGLDCGDGLIVSVEGTFEHVWCTGDHFFILKLITVSHTGKTDKSNQIKCPSLRNHSNENLQHTFTGNKGEKKKTAATMLKVKHASR